MKKIIDVAEEIKTPSALTQELGDIIYYKLVDCFERKERVALDFINVESMISPFLNNAIGQLYGKYTSEEITQYLELLNFPPNKNATLNIVISNAKSFYANKIAFTKTAKDVLNLD